MYNDEVEIVGLKPTKKTVVTGIEMFRKQLDFAEAGDNAGVLLRGIDRSEVERGQVLTKRDQFIHIRNLKHKFMYFLKKKVEDILHSLQTTDLNSISELLMLLV